MAYADFVTALMALFIVLWLMNSSNEIRGAVSRYFRDPKGYTKTASTDGPSGNPGAGIALNKANVQSLKSRLEESMRQLPEFQKIKKYVQVTVTGEGLRVELLETEQGMFFETGSPNPTPNGEVLLRLLAGELGHLPNAVVVEGHTDGRPYRFGKQRGYSNWELSSDRANTARRLMQENGLSPEQVVQIRGFADKSPLVKEDPNNTRNRRVSVIVSYREGESEPSARVRPRPQ